MSEQFHPEKYREFQAAKDAQRTAVIDPALERLRKGEESPQDRARIERRAHTARVNYGYDFDEEEPIDQPQQKQKDTTQFRVLSDAEDATRHAEVYERILPLIVDAQETLKVTQKSEITIFSQHEEPLVVDQPFIDGMVTIGNSIRNTLFDRGYQKVVTEVEHNTGIFIQEQEGGDTHGKI